jgi:hypothetical protein
MEQIGSLGLIVGLVLVVVLIMNKGGFKRTPEKPPKDPAAIEPIVAWLLDSRGTLSLQEQRARLVAAGHDPSNIDLAEQTARLRAQPAAAFCPKCGTARPEGAAFCPKCGAPYGGSNPDSVRPPARTRQVASEDLRTGALVTIAGGILAIVGAILPWASIMSISMSGLQGDGMISAGAGAVALVVGLVCLRKPMSLAMATLAIVAGLVALGIAVLDGPNIAKHVGQSGLATMGPGIFVTGLGGVLCILGAGIGRQRS